NYFVAPQEPPAAEISSVGKSSHRGAFLLTGVIVLSACAVLCFQRPGLDRTGNALQPQHGEAQTTLDEMTAELGLPPQPLWLIISGRDEAEVYQRITKAEESLNGAVTNHLIGRYRLPDTLWPRAEFQTVNRTTA